MATAFVGTTNPVRAAEAIQSVAQLEEEASVNNALFSRSYAFLQQWYGSLVVLITDLHDEAQVHLGIAAVRVPLQSLSTHGNDGADKHMQGTSMQAVVLKQYLHLFMSHTGNCRQLLLMSP